MKGLKKTKNSSAMMRGMLLEPFAREKAKKELGYDFYPTVVQSVEDPWRFASLDGFYQSGNHVEALEIKCPGEKDHQTALEGNVPKKYFPQLQHIADVLNIPSVHYYSFDGKEGVHLLVKKDPDYCQKIKLIEMQFLDCLIKKVPPEASDMDWIKISDSRAIKGAKRVVCIQKQIKKLEAEKKTIYDQFDSIVDHKKSLAGKIKLQRICKKGAVEWLEIPAISFLEQYYNADVEKELVGGSVPATEHSVMCMGEKDSEIDTFKYLLSKYPKGILSVVSDTWDLWKVCTEYITTLKDEILSREGKLVIRPDSGDPVDIICGLAGKEGYYLREDDKNRLVNAATGISRSITDNEYKGVIELLWEVFGGTISSEGYKVLDPHIGAIYGDSITIERASDIVERLKEKGFASTNIVFGIGSFTYQYNTRDTFGFAVKATYGEVNHMGREIFKDPITDDGTKKSAKGLIKVVEVLSPDSLGYLHHDHYELVDQVSPEEEAKGELKEVFVDGKLLVDHTLGDIRNRLSNFL